MKDNVKKTFKGIGYLLLAVFLVNLVINSVASVAGHNSQPTATADYNTSRNGFISSCTTGAKTTYAQTFKALNITPENFCGCAFDSLNDYYKGQGNPNWYADDTLVARITTQGYNPTESGVIQTCLPTQPNVQTQ